MGSIVKTNAEYVSGQRITLLEMDVEALLADEEKFKALQGKIGPDATLSQVKPLLKDIKGIKIDGPSISVGSGKEARSGTSVDRSRFVRARAGVR